MYTLINKNLKRNFSMLKIKHPPDMALGGVKAVPHTAGRLMKGPQLSDNLFSVGLSVNHVDSISWDLTAGGCAPSSISLTSEASGGWRKREKETKRGKYRLVLLLYAVYSSFKYSSPSDNRIKQHDAACHSTQCMNK